jgi:ketosteroid isomerase-like protein
VTPGAAAGHPVVDAYVEAVNAADLGRLLELFAEGAVLENAVGAFTGRSAIAGFYRDVVFAGEARVSVDAVVVAPDAVTATLSATSPLDPGAATVRAIDVFRLDDAGRIVGLAIEYL